MNSDRRDAPQGVPTLTEVLAIPEPGRDASLSRDGAPARDLVTASGQPAPSRDAVPLSSAGVDVDGAKTPAVAGEPPQGRLEAPAPAAPTLPAVSADDLTQRVLADVQAQVDQLLEHRLREVLTPILTRASDAVVRDARSELSRSLKDIVSGSVARELSRQRSR